MLPDLDVGGGQQVVLRNITHSDRSCFRHSICYFLPNHDLAPAFHEAGFPTIFIPVGGWRSSLHVLKRLTDFVRKEKIDLIHVNGTPIDKLYGQIAAAICRVPVVLTLHGPKWRPGRLGGIIKNGLRELAEYALEPMVTRHVISVSDAVQESWRIHLHSRGLPPDRMSVIHNGVPVNDSQTATPAESIFELRS